MSPQELDVAAARLEAIELEEEKLRSELRDQVEEFGFTPPRAEKSKRLAGTLYQFTVSRGLITDILDAEVERIREACPSELFSRLFRAVTQYKLAEGATLTLASRIPDGAPRNLRLMFARAVQTKEASPRLRIEKADVPCCTPMAPN